MFNHALLKGDDFYEDKIKEINPTLVIHGTEDTILPFEHALALIDEFPYSLLVTLKGTGHENHSDDWTGTVGTGKGKGNFITAVGKFMAAVFMFV